MSTRALRRLQREEEERKQQEILQKEGNSTTVNAEDDSDSEESLPEPKIQRNAFDFLNAEEEDEEDESEGEEQNQDQDQPKPSIAPETTPSSSKKSKKKSKKKKKKKQISKAPTPEPESEHDLDEIDRALKSLDPNDSAGPKSAQRVDPGLRTFYDILSTDSKHLNPLNEMKKLFGSAILGGDREQTSNRRRGRGPTELGLEAALAARHSQASRGQGLAGLALRRNIFMVGKEEWPKATSGGLGMEIVEEAVDYTIEYRYIHSNYYQVGQRLFDVAVQSNSPEFMIHHLQLHPYHISSLLQVSEIAKQQGDHAATADLLERALFTFGRSVQSTFAASMASGRARLDFRRPENREFWLAAYRYIGTLGQRGTWRTAFEWAKLLLSLDPEQDPYSIRLIIDQLAIRGGQFDTLVKLAETSTDVVDWGQNMPNVQVSLSMAYYKLKQHEQARDTLQKAISQRPWLFANLCKELNIEPIPKAVWGRLPRTHREELTTLCYGLRAKDIWNTPEALSFLKSVLETAPRDEPPPIPTNPDEINLSLAECRHVMLSEIPALLAILPRDISNSKTSASDPLPPPDDLPSYFNHPDDTSSSTTPTAEPTQEELEEELAANQQESAGLRSWFTGMLQRIGVTVAPGTDSSNDAAREQMASAFDTSGINISEFATQTARMEELRGREAMAEQRLAEFQQRQRDATTNDNETTTDQTQHQRPRDWQRLLQLAVQQEQDQQQAIERVANAQQAFVEDVPDEEDNSAGPSQTAQQQQPLLSPNIPNEPSLPNGGTYDDEANQRWLAGRGMLRLKDFIAAHGSDENKWKDDLEIDVTPATEYAHRITLLKKRASKEFILNYALAQGAGSAASALIRRLLA